MRYVNLAMMVFGYLMFVYLLLAVIQDLRKRRRKDAWIEHMNRNGEDVSDIIENLHEAKKRIHREEVQRRRDLH